MDKVIYKELSFKICGLLYKTHNELGRYRNEKQYADKFEELLKINGVKYKREQRLVQSFAGEKEGRNICDFIIEEKIIIEMKAKTFLDRDDYFQTKRYLASSGLRLAIIVNFRQKFLTPRRILNNDLLKTSTNEST